jgi:TPP-dependent indolepyruvate ferredoxin oxidoreductase alpha subunit
VAKAKVKDTLTKRKRQSSTEKELTQKKYDWRKYQKKCSTDGCTILLSRGERAEARCKDQTMCYGTLQCTLVCRRKTLSFRVGRAGPLRPQVAEVSA